MLHLTFIFRRKERVKLATVGPASCKTELMSGDPEPRLLGADGFHQLQCSHLVRKVDRLLEMIERFFSVAAGPSDSRKSDPDPASPLERPCECPELFGFQKRGMGIVESTPFELDETELVERLLHPNLDRPLT